ncbi:hypothetical protein D6M20_01845 (plasmid) [Rhodococcus qingshengii]|jgi:hypothetical protein|uniref:hypothetical protein n=1 Tax=Rhodococcus qingshengii TaxID=334542 RepID=UPI0011EF41FB|nr:hypothetical protein [Rhodococcus qingshengii]QEM25589.1 hypothetical protein D6M20_01845 [Rhodococcus qingshengii]
MNDRFLSPTEALGQRRVDRIEKIRPKLRDLDVFIDNASTMDILLKSITHGKFEKLKSRSAFAPKENWLFARDDSTDTYLCTDDGPDDLNPSKVYDALFYPELHTGIVAWWLLHAWRFTDLAEEAIRSLTTWHITVSAVSSRALIEEVGCILYESKKFSENWKKSKSLPEPKRPLAVRELLHPVMVQSAFGSRGITDSTNLRPAPNVQTYVDKLAKETGEPQFLKWYAWLSNSAHPAIGSRMAYASQPIVHTTGAVMRRRFSRRPTSINGRSEELDFLIAHQCADSTVAAVQVGLSLLSQALEIVDDIGLTTGAATLTRHTYWRNLKPVRGNRQCPCGKGKWPACQHRWGGPTPAIAVEHLLESQSAT